MAGGHGGRRPGTGRKKKSLVLRSIDGGANRRGPLPTTNSDQVIAPIEEFDAPDDLTMEERQVWMKLASHAFQNRTLTRATALAFEMLCRNLALERRLAGSALARGGADHRGIIQRVDAELLRFNLAPCGKPMYEAQPEKPANPLERFLKRAKQTG
jgi:hypothetical protein